MGGRACARERAAGEQRFRDLRGDAPGLVEDLACVPKPLKRGALLGSSAGPER